MGKLKVNIVISGRTYPLEVKDVKEEESMRKAALNINKLISLYEQNYAVNDKQDVLAMCALRFAFKLEILSLEKNTDRALQKINELNTLLNSHLE